MVDTPTKARLLVGLGRKVRPSLLARLRLAVGLLESGAWPTSGQSLRWVNGREELFEMALQRLQNAKRPLYLEFGVASGASMRWWSQHLPQPDAQLIGFDSFEGLPHDWSSTRGALTKGSFAQAEIPSFDDSRVRLEVGWFEDTMRDFEIPDHDALVVNLDADLYSSTAFILNALSDSLAPGVLVHFDEFPLDEQSALADYCSGNDSEWRAIAAEDRGFRWLFEVVS
jgi:hypothetical protein